ncbi:universal stress protein [uncultured Desulfobacter sp.]|uniref:universal stress protein n=1 Tax=uncultured Desulfobacter sp. TaxID=240139 RepID=UPI002AAB11DC|nr:universal stress protein [uncultured Desulfobacter sp.]
MDRHFLITVSDQKSALYGVRFVGDFFPDKTNIKTTLFFSGPQTNPGADQEKELQAKGEQALEQAGTILMEKGFSKKNIMYKSRSSVLSTVTDIIQEAEKGTYDAVVLGRRGINILEEAFDESISEQLFKEKPVFPLWLCNTREGIGKDVLLYLDGSPASFQMADHVGFILAESKKHHIDLLAPESVFLEPSLMDQYIHILSRNNLDINRIRTQLPVSSNPAQQILKLTAKKTYAAVALGKAGSESNNILSRLSKGPVCSVLFKEMKHASLWLCG